VLQNVPFSPTMTGRRTPPRSIGSRPLGEHVVRDHGVSFVLDEVVGAVRAERLFVRDAEVDERAFRLEPEVARCLNATAIGR
jgi:hypothetical protein